MGCPDAVASTDLTAALSLPKLKAMATTLEEVRKLVEELPEPERHILTSELIEKSGPAADLLTFEELNRRYDNVMNGSAVTTDSKEVHAEARKLAGL